MSKALRSNPIKLQVISQTLMFDDTINDWARVNCTIYPDYAGQYVFRSDAYGEYKWGVTFTGSIAELVVKDLDNGNKHLEFYHLRSNQFQPAQSQFMVAEISADEWKRWNDEDVWVAEDLNVLVRTEGKKFYGKPYSGVRCMTCHYLQNPNNTKCDRGCE